MSKAKHTKGKWEVGKTARNEFTSIWVGGTRIALVDEVPHEGSEANGRLIAASPEMYDALRKVNNFISANMGKNYMVALLNREVPEIKGLIKKIEG